MALKKDSEIEEISTSRTSISPELVKQLQNNFTAPTVSEEPKFAEVKKASDKKPNYKNIFNVHMGTGDKARLKTFCAAREVPINTFILFAIEHLIDEVEEGKCTVSKSGIRMIKKEM